MSDTWRRLKEWPELVLERLADAGVARVVLNRPEKRNAWNEPLVAAFFEALEIVRADRELKTVITMGAGPCFSAGLDLHFLKAVSSGPLLDWDRPTATIRLAEAIRVFPRVMIAQVHGYCLGGALGIVNCHDLVFAAEDAQLGMPEILRGSFGQLVTSTLVHGGIPIKKVALIQLLGRNLSGTEADRLGIVSQALPAAELESSLLDPTAEVQAENRFYKVTPKTGEPVTGRLLNRDTFTVQLLDLDERLRSFNMADLREHGFDETPMPSVRRKLSQREIADVVSYLSSLRSGVTP